LIEQVVGLVKEGVLKVLYPVQLGDIGGLKGVLEDNDGIVYDDAGENYRGCY
jgi:hypothetical protein